MQNPFRHVLPTILLLVSFQCAALAQQVLIISGHAGQAEVIQKAGRAYVDLQSLAEITNGSLSYKKNRIVLSLPASNVSHPAVEPASEPIGSIDDSGLSRDFMRAGIESFATMREWASTMANAVQNSYQITEEWTANYREQAANNLRLASAAAITEGDRNALKLLDHEFEAVHEWSNKLIAAKKSMDTAKYALSPGTLENEALSQKIITCGRFLAKMLGSSSFQDDASCH